MCELTISQKHIITERNNSKGEYQPAFMQIRIHNSFDGNIDELDVPTLGTLVHEYIHFLQNVSTPWGLYDSMVRYNIMAETYAFVENATSTITLPLNIDYSQGLKNKMDIVECGTGYCPLSDTRRNNFKIDVSERICIHRNYKKVNNRNLPIITLDISFVEKSLDSYKFNLLHCKQTFISQLKSGAMEARTIDEGAMDEKSGMNFSEYMALLSGNTDLLDKAKLEKRIASLEGERKSFNKGKRDSEFKLESKTRELGNNTAFIDAMTEDWNRFLSVVQTDKEGNHLNIIKVDGVDSADEKVIGKRLQEIAKNATTGGLYTQVGEFYGFPIKVVSERILKEGLEFTDNRFVVEGNYKYTYNNGHLALADPLAAARNFLNAIERIPSIIDQYKAKNEVLEREIPQLQEIAGKVWKKEEELKQLKSELAALDRKIQLELAPPTPEITEKEHEGQQVKPEAKGVRNGIRQYPEDTSPQIRNPSESIIANHTITGHPGLYAKEETRSKGLKI